AAGRAAPAPYVMASSTGGYTTNVPVGELADGKSLVAYAYEGRPVAPGPGGPGPLLRPHLYFWKSAKWTRGVRFMDADARGCWEAHGYHIYGAPWKEQRYDGD